ncbi:preprotein translocase subunit SecG [Salisaeta longa]|uniref:preprotein translocase subunit SecG n=1 Tax=Salisaeta longa TaxID=503170 RepID=UPI0003B7BA29|nr:preprotein translocase subunit SecG [Salisaeta longa]
MFTFLIVLIALIALLMSIIILLQSGQGGGLAGIASTGATRQVLGSRQAPDLLEKATWTLASIFVVLCILSNFFIDTGEEGSVIQQNAQQGQTQQTAPQPPAPGQGAAPLPGNGAAPSGNGAGTGGSN